MRFRRRGDEGNTPGAPDFSKFWTWWAGARDGLGQAIAEGTVEKHVDEISGAVQALHPNLVWELGSGKAAKHMFVVSPEGDPELRVIAIRWEQSAPPPDGTWEYHASRQASERGKAALKIGGVLVGLDEIRSVTSWDEGRERLAVRLWHAALEGLPHEGRIQFAFLFLDDLIGEDQVERWIGAIEVDASAQAGKTADELAAEFARRAETATGERWVLAEGTDQRGDRLLVRYNAALKHIDRPFANQHLEVAVNRGFDHAADRVLYEAIAEAEEQLNGALDGVAVEAAHLTDRRRRVTHFVCEDGAQALGVAREWAGAHKTWGTSAEVEYDPRWEFRRAYSQAQW